MKLKIIITTMALTAVCLGVHAQEKKTNPNPWFVQGQMGASYSTGDADFGKLIAPTGAIAVGKYFSPVWGARLAISGWRGNQQTGPRFLLRRSHRRRIDEPQPTHQEISRTIVRSQRYSRYRFQPYLQPQRQ